MALPKPTHNFVNLPAQTVFVPKSCYVSALKLSLELALELRLRCDDELHRSQVAEIDAALLEVGEGRLALQSIADRAELIEIERSFFRTLYAPMVARAVQTTMWECQNVRVTQREYNEISLGDSVQTRGVVAVVTMRTHQYRGGYFVRLDFRDSVSA